MSRSTSAHTAHGQSDTAVRHSRDDALSDREFERLVAASYRLDEYWSLQCRFVLLVAGRLGLRAGEIAHMDEEWIDWRRNMICIPARDRCTNGRDGGLCGHCRSSLEQMARVRSTNGYADVHAELASRDELEPGGGRAAGAIVDADDLDDGHWRPKTDAAAREVPFDADTRASIVVEEYFERFDEYTHSRQSINRRVERVATEARGIDPDDVYPHALRATAASHYAAHGLDVFSLKAMMGWADLSTAKNYISTSGERTAQAIRDIKV